MWLLSIVPGLCIGPFLVVSACITCSPPTLPTLLGFLPTGVWHAVLLSTTRPLAPVCVPRPGAGREKYERTREREKLEYERKREKERERERKRERERERERKGARESERAL